MNIESRRQVAEAVRAIEEKKGEDLAILEMAKDSGAFTDYFVVCSGSNPRQIQAIADEVERRVSNAGSRPASIEGYKQAEWVLLDYVDFVVHIFSPHARQFYDLERLWKAARRVTLSDLVKKPTVQKASATQKVTKAKITRKVTPSRPGKTVKAKAPASKTPVSKTSVSKTPASKTTIRHTDSSRRAKPAIARTKSPRGKDR